MKHLRLYKNFNQTLQVYRHTPPEAANEILQDIQGTPLYHHTTESRALSIMGSDTMKGTRPDDDIIEVDPTLANTPNQSMVSLTRDKGFKPSSTIGAGSGGIGDASKLKVIFVLDKEKLRSHYKVVPFDYKSLEDRWKEKRQDPEDREPTPPRMGKDNEYEERVLTNKIFPLRRYLIDIIYKGNDPSFEEKKNEYLGSVGRNI